MLNKFIKFFEDHDYAKIVVEMIGWALIWFLFSVCVVYGIVLTRIYI